MTVITECDHLSHPEIDAYFIIFRFRILNFLLGKNYDIPMLVSFKLDGRVLGFTIDKPPLPELNETVDQRDFQF